MPDQRLAVVHNPLQTAIADARAAGAYADIVGFTSLARHGEEPPPRATSPMPQLTGARLKRHTG